MDARVVVALALLGLILAGSVVYMHNRMPSLPGRIPLVAEYGDNGVVVLEQAISPSPGTVWQLQQTPSGLMFVEKDSKLVEELELTNVTLQGGDTIAPHLYDAYFGGDSYVFMDTFNVTGGFSAYALLYAQDLVKGGESFTNGRFMGVGDGYYGSGGWHLQINTGSIGLWYRNSTTRASTYIGVEARWAWHGIGVVYDGANWYVYVDGNETYSEQKQLDMVASTLTFSLMHAPYGDTYVKGYLAYGYIAPDKALVYKPYLPSNGYIFDPTWYNGTSYNDIVHNEPWTTAGTVRRVPASQIWLWYLPQLATDGNVHFRYMPPNTIVKITDRVSGETWTYTVTGTANQAGLIPDYVVTPPTSNTVDIKVYVPSERVRFYVPSGFTVEMEDTNNGVTAEANNTDGVVTLAGGNIIRLIAQRESKLYLSVNDTPAVYRVTVRLPDNTPAADAYVWIRDPNGNTLAYGKTDGNGVYELAKKPGIPSAIRVEAAYLSGGTYYHAQQDFQLKAEDTSTPSVTPQPSLLSNSQFKLVAIGFGFLILLLAAAIVLAVRR